MNLKRCENGHFYDAEKFQSCPHCSQVGGDAGATQPYSAYSDPMDEPVTMPLKSYGMQGVAPGMPQIDGMPTGQVTASPQMNAVQMSAPQMNAAQMSAPQMNAAQVNAPQQYGIPQMQGVPQMNVAPFGGPQMNAPQSHAVQMQGASGMQEGLSLKDAVGRAVTAPVSDDDDDGKTVSLYQKKIGIEPVVGWLVCIEGKAFGESFKLKSGRNFIGRSAGMDVIIPGDESISREKHAIILYEPRKREFIAQAGESRELFYLNDDVVLNPMRLKANDIVTIGNTRLMFFPCCGENFSWDDYKKDGE